MRKALGATLLSVALVVGVAGGPADAGRSVTVIDSPNDAHRGIDMHRVTFQKLKGSIQIRTTFSHMGSNLNGMQYYFDTKKLHPGPEFGAVINRDKDRDGLTSVHVYRMSTWTKPGEEIICSTANRWRINANGTGIFTARFAYGCLKVKSKKLVRAAVRSWDYTKYRGIGDRRRGSFGYNDLMRTRRTLSPWF